MDYSNVSDQYFNEDDFNKYETDILRVPDAKWKNHFQPLFRGGRPSPEDQYIYYLFLKKAKKNKHTILVSADFKDMGKLCCLRRWASSDNRVWSSKRGNSQDIPEWVTWYKNKSKEKGSLNERKKDYLKGLHIIIYYYMIRHFI